MSFLKALGLTAVLYFCIGLTGYIALNLLFFVKHDFINDIHSVLQFSALILSYFLVWKYFINHPFTFKISKFNGFDERLFFPIVFLALGFTIIEQPLFDLYYKFKLPEELYKSFPYEEHKLNFTAYVSFVSSVIVTPIVEELFFRKFLLIELKKKYSVQIAVVLSTLLFSAFHLPNFGNLLPPFILGITSAFLYLKSGKIMYSILLHALANLNVFLFNYFGRTIDENLQQLNFNLYYWLIFAAGIGILLFGLRMFSEKLKEKPQEKL